MPLHLERVCSGIFLLPKMKETPTFKERLQLAAIHMKAGNLGLAAKSVFGSRHGGYAEKHGDEYFYTFGGNGSDFNISTNKEIFNAFVECSPLSAILIRKGLAYANGQNWVVDVDAKRSDRNSTSKVAKKINKIMSRPNAVMNRRQFDAIKYIYIQAFGYCPVYAYKKPVGFGFEDAESLWILPPHLTTLEFNKGSFANWSKNNGLKYASINFGDTEMTLNVDNIFIYKDINISLNGFNVLPQSRMVALKPQINNIVSAYAARGVLIRNRGVQGMIVNRTQDAAAHVNLSQQDKDEVNSRFSNLYGWQPHQSPVLLTNKNLEWQSMVLPTKDLMLFEEIEDDIDRICDTYAFPKPLIANMGKGTTYSNMDTAGRNLYQDAIIPEAEALCEQDNEMFETYKYNLSIQKDYSRLPILQPDAKAAAEAMTWLNKALEIEFRNNNITLGEWRIAQGRDPHPRKEYNDMYYSDIKHLLDNKATNEEITIPDYGASSSSSSPITDNPTQL